MLYTNQNSNSKFEKAFKASLLSADEIRIASGYTSFDTIKIYQNRLLSIAHNGGIVKILVGMARFSGISEPAYYQLLNLNNKLKQHYVENGIYISTTLPYHGKIYEFSSQGNKTAFIGSSNFSCSGLKGNLEATSSVEDANKIREISGYLDALFTDSFSKNIIELKATSLIKSKKKELINLEQKALAKPLKSNNTKFKNLNKSSLPSCSISISRVVGNMGSSINAYFGKGRKIPNTNNYKPRGWYEVQIVTSSAEQSNPHFPKGNFTAYTDDDFVIPMKTFGGNNGKKNFSSQGSEKIFGEWFKGKLEKEDILHKFEPITLEMLAEYGSDQIVLYKINNNEYYMTF